MISAGEVRKLHLPTYLEVLSKLPHVSSQDIATARQVLQSVFGDNYFDPVEFRRGEIQKNGQIEVVQIYETKGRPHSRVTISFAQTGGIVLRVNDLNGYSSSIPYSVAFYFVGGVFGIEELSLGPNEASWIYDQEDTSVILKKIEGIRDLYRCVVQKGNIAACGEADGLGKFAEAERLVQARKEAETAAARQRAEEAARAQALAEQQRRAQQRDSDMRRSEELWRMAEELREASRGFADGDPDDIQEIMGRYALYRYYAGTADEIANVQVRREQAERMMHDIGSDSGGWPQFRKRFCGEPTEVSETSSSTSYRIGCSFGVSKEYSVQKPREDKGLGGYASERAADRAAGIDKSSGHRCP